MVERAALITGASVGIGYAVAETLLKDGYGVTVCSRSTERIEAAAKELAEHGDVHPVTADVTDATAVDELIGSHKDRFGRLDVLVNNAGTVTIGTLTTSPVDQLEQMFHSNVRSNWLVTAAASPLLQEAGAEHGQATVVTLSSVLGHHGYAFTPAYSAAKAALFALTEAVHGELSGNGVRATTIGPSFVKTPMTEPLTHLDRDSLIDPNDLAEAVRFLTRLSRNATVPEILMLRPSDSLLAPG